MMTGVSWLTATAAAQSNPSAAALVAEVKRTFTIQGKPIPPEIFRDFGDGDLADSGSIWVTVDIEAATGSNLYADDIKQDNGWVSQHKANDSINGAEETGYKYIGATANGLLVAIASYSGGGSGTFYTLHIMDIAAAKAFDLDGKLYDRVNLTNIRGVPLGDRWNGEVSISGDAIRVLTTRTGPADNGSHIVKSITATRP
jgi:hypothetical protein